MEEQVVHTKTHMQQIVQEHVEIIVQEQAEAVHGHQQEHQEEVQDALEHIVVVDKVGNIMHVQDLVEHADIHQVHVMASVIIVLVLLELVLIMLREHFVMLHGSVQVF